VSVIVPFRGDAAQAERLLVALGALALGPDDEIIVADNSDEPVIREGPGIRVVRATREKSSYHARNCGAAASNGAERRNPFAMRANAPARAEGAPRWLLFVDADCVPWPDLVDAYFDPAPGDDVGALAGAVVSDPDQTHFLARYAADRGFLDQEAGVHTGADAAATANLAIRREAFEELGGFEEGIRSGGDVDLCRRLVAGGWRIERRSGAIVTHLHRESLPDLLSAIARYASGASWLNERYPDSARQWPVMPGLIGASRDIAANLMRLRFEEAAFRGLDGVGLVAHAIGYRRSNAAG
jgi:GT2 family glycosyltransferase